MVRINKNKHDAVLLGQSVLSNLAQMASNQGIFSTSIMSPSFFLFPIFFASLFKKKKKKILMCLAMYNLIENIMYVLFN